MTDSLGSLRISGISGRTYLFKAFPLETVFDGMGAIYFITHRRKVRDGRMAHSRIYCGETSDLSARPYNNSQADSFVPYGPNCICILPNEDPRDRRAIEKDIHSNYKLLCDA